MKKLPALFFFLVFLVSFASAEGVDDKVKLASQVIASRMASPQPIPDNVLKAARCVAALKVLKGAVFWKEKDSTGVITCRTSDNQWSEPAFFEVSNVSFGFQFGKQSLEAVLIVITDSGEKDAAKLSFTLGTDITFAAGPVGTDGGSTLPNAEVVAYQSMIGLPDDATVDGFTLKYDPDLINEAYGDEIYPSNLFRTSGTGAPSAVKPFLDTMNTYFPQR